METQQQQQQQQLRAHMAESTAGWTVVCSTYLLRRHPTTTCDDETRKLQERGFAHLAAMEACETELARLEARVPFAPG